METSYDFLNKILLVGDSCVGKDVLLEKLSNGMGTSAATITTIGVDFKIHNCTIDGHRVKIQLWDTAGQERFRVIDSTFYRGADGIIFVFDPCNEQSFNNAKQFFQQVKEAQTTETSRLQQVHNRCSRNSCRADILMENVVESDGFRSYGLKLIQEVLGPTTDNRSRGLQQIDLILAPLEALEAKAMEVLSRARNQN